MHKCWTCLYAGEYHNGKFVPQGVCTKELNLIDAVNAYNAKECPFVNKEVKKDAKETTL